ncbi:MAG TPA: hypothetical protein VGL53_19790, partial [Bryobacteraceae bacterium]
MRSLAPVAAFLLVAMCGVAQPKPPDWTASEKPIYDQLRTLRKVPDDQRGEVTRKLALEIRALTSPGQLRLASALASLATEGDFGKQTLQEVATTLASAIERNPPLPDKSGSPAAPYQELAEYVRYEH